DLNAQPIDLARFPKLGSSVHELLDLLCRIPVLMSCGQCAISRKQFEICGAREPAHDEPRRVRGCLFDRDLRLGSLAASTTTVEQIERLTNRQLTFGPASGVIARTAGAQLDFRTRECACRRQLALRLRDRCARRAQRGISGVDAAEKIGKRECRRGRRLLRKGSSTSEDSEDEESPQSEPPRTMWMGGDGGLR